VVIPASAEYTYKLKLRKKYIGDFINNETALYAYKTRRGMELDSLMALVGNSYRETIQYTVKSGESMASIAKKFNMTVSELKSLNNLKKNYVKSRQKLLVYSKGKEKTQPGLASATPSKTSASVKKDSSAVQKSSAPVPASSGVSEAAPITHTVKSGESLGLIASKYHCSVDQIRRWNDMTSDKLVIGQKLKIFSPANQQVSVSKQEQTNGKTVKGTAQPTGKYTIYMIQSGDNLWEIADKFDVTVSQIKELNNITNTNRLKPGQKIKIPK
jgi:membrane-bound lytic murein transglycosylase D